MDKQLWNEIFRKNKLNETTAEEKYILKDLKKQGFNPSAVSIDSNKHIVLFNNERDANKYYEFCKKAKSLKNVKKEKTGNQFRVEYSY